MDDGKSSGQALAAAYSIKKKARGGQMCAHGKYMCQECHGGKMAEGGTAHHEHKPVELSEYSTEELNPLSTIIKHKGKWIDTVSPSDIEKAIKKHRESIPHHMAKGGFMEEEKSSGYRSMPEEHEKKDAAAMHEDSRMLNQHGSEEVAAHGTDEDDEHHMDVNYSHPKENQGYPQEEDHLVDRIMKQRVHHYSKGGQIANKTEVIADFEPNEFDELAKDDDDMEDADYTGANSGDEIGNAQEDEDQHDIVSRIMKSRRLKDKLPKAGVALHAR